MRSGPGGLPVIDRAWRAAPVIFVAAMLCPAGISFSQSGAPSKIETTSTAAVLPIESASPVVVQDLYAMPPRHAAMSKAEVDAWFTPISGQDGGLRQLGDKRSATYSVEGLLRLTPPWKTGHALRFWVGETQGFKLHFWDGQKGVTIQYYTSRSMPARNVVAYHTTRRAAEPRPLTLNVAANDQQRLWRVDPPTIWGETAGMLDLSYEDGQLIVSCADIRVLSVPIDARPDEIYFEGAAQFRQINFVPAVKFADEPAAPRGEPIGRPADLTWSGGDGGAQLTLQKPPDGAMIFSARNNGATATAVTPLRRPLIADVVLQLENVTAGTGVFLGKSDHRSVLSLGFFAADQSGGLVVESSGGRPRISGQRSADRAAPPLLVSGTVWMRLSSACDGLRYWISTDGVHWAMGPDGVEPTRDGDLGERRGRATPGGSAVGFDLLGVYCAAGADARSITVKRITLIPMRRLNALAPEELIRRSPVIDAPHLSEWLESAEKARPKDVPPGDWLPACAIRTLASGQIPSGVATSLLQHLVEAGLRRPGTVGEKFELLDEAASLHPTASAGQGVMFTGWYERVGAAAIAAAGPDEVVPILDATRRAVIHAPMCSSQVYSCFPATLIGDQMSNLAYASKWTDMYRMARQAQFTRGQVRSAGDAFDWGESTAAAALAGKIRAEDVKFIAWKAPVTLELNKDGFSDMYELSAAMQQGANLDACRIIVKASTRSSGKGLLPYSADPQLTLSWPTAVRLLMRQSPDLRATMQKEFAGEARLRIRQAVDSSDPVAMRFAALHYEGTQAATEAQLWLGDQAMIEGSAAEAMSHYRHAAENDDGSRKSRLESGRQLAAAMLGRSLGAAPAGPATFGRVRLTPDELEALRQAKAAAGSDKRIGSRADCLDAPAPSGFQLTAPSRYEGEFGENVQSMPQVPIDVQSQQIAMAVDGNRLLLSNRFHLASYDLQTGLLQWRASVGREPGRNEWPGSAYSFAGIPMRPLVSGGRVFVRRIQQSVAVTRQTMVRGAVPESAPSITLSCVDESTGRVIWTTPWNARSLFVTDPVIMQDQLVVLVARTSDDREWTLTWCVLDPGTGAMISQAPLVTLRESWKQMQSLDIASADEGLIVAGLGVVLSIDWSGELRWARREVMLPPTMDANWSLQCLSPPIVRGDRCYVVQPGVRVVSCIETATGRLMWRSPVSGLRKLVGVADGRVVVQGIAGFVALDAEDGREVWRHDADDTLAGQLCGGAGGLLFARAQSGANGGWLPVLTWVGLKDGRELGRAPLVGLRQDWRMRFGPMVTAGGRIWALASRVRESDALPVRDLVELVPSGAAEVPAAGAAKATELQF